MTVLYDSVSYDQIPSGAQAVAGYTAGAWPTVYPLRQRFPNLAKAGRVVSIAIQASYDADALDMEAGDAAVSDAGWWTERQLARGLHRPILYCAVSSMAEVLGVLRSHGIARSEVRLWTAHRNEQPHLCGNGSCGYNLGTLADATQWTWTALGRSLDESLCADNFFTTVKPAFDPHYAYYIEQPKVRERSVVEAYDQLRNRSFPFIVAHRRRLRDLRNDLESLAGRVAREAHEHPLKDGKPSWSEFHRGFRYQGIVHRSQGQRIG